MQPYPNIITFITEGTKVVDLKPSPEDNACPICLEQCTDASKIAECSAPLTCDKCVPHLATQILKCKHVFGMSCLNTWVKQANTCPMCRDVLFRTEEPEPEPEAEEVDYDRIFDSYAQTHPYDNFFARLVEKLYEEFCRCITLAENGIPVETEAEMRTLLYQFVFVRNVDELPPDELAFDIQETSEVAVFATMPDLLQEPHVLFDIAALVPLELAPSLDSLVSRWTVDRVKGACHQCHVQTAAIMTVKQIHLHWGRPSSLS